MKTRSRSISLMAILLAFTAAVSHAATRQATPQDFTVQLVLSHPGDTINFAAGTYSVAPNSVTFPASRHYVGNGAVFVNTSPAGTSGDLVKALGGTGNSDQTEITGFIFTGGQLACDASGNSGSFYVHGNTFTDTVNGNGIFIGGCFNSAFNQNTFANMASDGGIYGYPGNNTQYDNNSFTNTAEPIHLVANCTGVDVSGNVITGASRIAIELGDGMQNVTINNNWVGNWGGTGQGHMGISCATGGNSDRTSGKVGCGNNITISGNTLLDNGEGLTNTANHWQDACIELMGTNITVTNNIDWNYACFILNGQWGPCTVSGNQIYISGSLFSNDNVNPPPTAITTTDVVQAIGAYTPTKPLPVVSTTIGRPIGRESRRSHAPGCGSHSRDGCTTPSRRHHCNHQRPTRSGFGDMSRGINAGNLCQHPGTQLDGESGNGRRHVGEDRGIPLNWKVSVTVTTGGTTYTLPPLQITDSPVPSGGPFNPSLVANAAPTTAPAPSILEFQSVDGGKTITRTN